MDAPLNVDECREFLASRGYRLGAAPRRHGNDRIWDVCSEGLPVFEHCLVNLNTGLWIPAERNRTKSWKPFQRGPWNELIEDLDDETPSAVTEAETPSGPLTERPYVITPKVAPNGRPVRQFFNEANLQFFVDLVEKCGFVITEPGPGKLLDGYIDLGNRSGMKNGVRYTLVCQLKVQKIIGRTGCHTIEDFLPGGSMHRGSDTGSEPQPKPIPKPRPVPQAERVPVASSGRSLQKGLF